MAWRQLIINIFDRFVQYPDEFEKPMLFISNEFDSKTIFEKLSNELNIGVLAKNKIVGYALLKFLRMIIDKHPLFDFKYFINKLEPTDNIDDIINEIKEDAKIFDLEKPITRNINTTRNNKCFMITITKKLDNIDMWNFEKIKEKIFINPDADDDNYS